MGFFNSFKEELREVFSAGLSKAFDMGTQEEQLESLRQDIQESEEEYGESNREEFFKEWEKSYYEGYKLRAQRALIRQELAKRGYYIDGATEEDADNDDIIPENTLMKIGSATASFAKGVYDSSTDELLKQKMTFSEYTRYKEDLRRAGECMEPEEYTQYKKELRMAEWSRLKEEGKDK